MRLMDDDEQAEESNAELQSDETNEPSSPSTSSSAPIRINCLLRLTTIFNHHRIGKVVAFDPLANLVTLRESNDFHRRRRRRRRRWEEKKNDEVRIDIRGSKSHLTSIALINLNHCREWTIEEESSDQPVESLYPIDVNKLKKRQIENEMEKRRETSLINRKASRLGQSLFRDLRRIMNQAVRWSNNDILINNTVRIVEPYRVENVSIDSIPSIHMKNSIKADNDTKTHLIKLVERFWSDPTKVTLDQSSMSTENPSDSSTLRDDIDQGQTTVINADPSPSV